MKSENSEESKKPSDTNKTEEIKKPPNSISALVSREDKPMDANKYCI